MSYRLKDLCNTLNVSFSGNGEIILNHVCGIDEIGTRANGLAYFTSPKEMANLPVPNGIFNQPGKDPETMEIHAHSALVVSESYQRNTTQNFIFAKDPLAVHVEATLLLHPPGSVSNTISQEASIGRNVKIGKGVTIDPKVVIYDNVSIGNDTIIRAGSVVMENSIIGENTIIHPNVSILGNCKIGNRVILHSNVVIGSDGFGYYQRKKVNFKIPQVGGVIIEDEVEIGAGSAIDRARFYDTIVRKGSKLDNLVHIAHNVEVGEHSFIAAQSGIAGSTRTGHHLIMGGQSGIKDHLHIGDHVTLLARTVLLSNTKSNTTVAGMPARAYKEWIENQALINRIGEIVKKVKQLEKIMRRFM